MPTAENLRAKAAELLREADRLTAGIDKAAAHSAQVAARSRERYRAKAEVGMYGAPANLRRKRRCGKSLLKFLTTYFPHSTGLRPFSADHKRMIADLERCIRNGGQLINAVYRGFAKTTVTENAAIWAALYGLRAFVLVCGMNKMASTQNIQSIKREFEDNDLLAEDFPEVCLYVRALEKKPQGAAHQTSTEGRFTNITWRADTIVLPTVEGSAASGAVIMAKPYAKTMGVKFKHPSGQQIRPDLALIDDPQDFETAATQLQVGKNLQILREGILQTAGHTKGLTAIVNATVMARNDMVETLLVDPAWEGRRIPMIHKWADAHDTLWLKDYAEIRQTFDRSAVGDKRRAKIDATKFYRKHRKAMDKGCVVSWKHCYSTETDPPELSAVQHAYNIYIDHGADTFASQYQQQPTDQDQGVQLTAAAVASKVNGIPRLTVPTDCHALEASIDVHDRLLYYALVALADGFRGAVFDWGAWPHQGSSFFSLASCPRPLADAYPGRVQDAYILAGLQDLTGHLLDRQYAREDGAVLKVGKLLIDAGWGDKTELVKAFCRRHPQYNAVVLPSFGAHVKPGDLLRAGRKPGGRFGPGWGIQPPDKGMVHVTFDADWVKTQLAHRLSVPMGTPGGWDLFGREPRVHALLAEHCTAERSVRIMRGDASKEHWELIPNQDNHLFDNLVMCFVAGLIDGVRLEGFESIPKVKRLSLAEMAARARGGR